MTNFKIFRNMFCTIGNLLISTLLFSQTKSETESWIKSKQFHFSFYQYYFGLLLQQQSF